MHGPAGDADLTEAIEAQFGQHSHAHPACILTPEMTEGPFFIDDKLYRSDLVRGEAWPGITQGYPLYLALHISAIHGNACRPLECAYVDIWHADLNGLYSGEPPTIFQATDTTGQSFSRAYQVTNRDGMVRFKTIYPGWYLTRTVHIHFKIRLYAAAGDKTFEATSQLYFDDSVTDRVFTMSPYAERGPRSIPRNSWDQVFNDTGPGSGPDPDGPPPGQTAPGLLTVARMTQARFGRGVLASLAVGLDLGRRQPR